MWDPGDALGKPSGWTSWKRSPEVNTWQSEYIPDLPCPTELLTPASDQATVPEVLGWRLSGHLSVIWALNLPKRQCGGMALSTAAYLALVVAQMVKNLPAVQETQIWSLGWEDPLKEMATHSRILAQIIPRTEEPGGLQSMGLQRVRQDWGTNTFTFSPNTRHCVLSHWTQNRRMETWLSLLVLQALFSRSVVSTLCNPMDCSTPGFPVLPYLSEFAQTHVHCVGDAIQPSHPLSPPSPPALSLSQHQGLFQWVTPSGITFIYFYNSPIR